MCVYLRAKFEVSSVILTSFRQGVEICTTTPPPPPPQNEPLKSPPRLGLRVNILIFIASIQFFSEKIISFREKLCIEAQQQIFCLFSYSSVFTIREKESFSDGSKPFLQRYL